MRLARARSGKHPGCLWYVSDRIKRRNIFTKISSSREQIKLYLVVSRPSRSGVMTVRPWLDLEKVGGCGDLVAGNISGDQDTS